MYKDLLNSLYFFLNIKLGNNINSFFNKFFFSKLNIYLILFNIIELNNDVLIAFSTVFDIGLNKIPFLFKIKFIYRNKKKIKVFIIKLLLSNQFLSFKIFLSEFLFFILYPRIKSTFNFVQLSNINLKTFYNYSLKFFFTFSINLLTLSYLNRFFLNFDINTIYSADNIMFKNVNFDFIIILNNNKFNLFFFKKFLNPLFYKNFINLFYFVFKRCLFLIYTFFYRKYY